MILSQEADCKKTYIQVYLHLTLHAGKHSPKTWSYKSSNAYQFLETAICQQ